MTDSYSNSETAVGCKKKNCNQNTMEKIRPLSGVPE